MARRTLHQSEASAPPPASTAMISLDDGVEHHRTAAAATAQTWGVWSLFANVITFDRTDQRFLTCRRNRQQVQTCRCGTHETCPTHSVVVVGRLLSCVCVNLMPCVFLRNRICKALRARSVSVCAEHISIGKLVNLSSLFGIFIRLRLNGLLYMCMCVFTCAHIGQHSKCACI